MKSINQNASVQCSKSIIINATPQNVWQTLTAINEWNSWQKEISRPALKGKLVPGANFTWKTGGAKIHSTIHTVQSFSQFGWTGKTFGIFAIHNWTLKEVSGQTEVKVEESMEGFLVNLFRKTFNRNLEKGMINWLEFLKLKCEI